MADRLDELVQSLLWEGYALYPYTPDATKNATPTPFGIVYPPAYAATLASTFDHLELRCVLEAPPDAVLSAELHFLAGTGERHRACSRSSRAPTEWKVPAHAIVSATVELRARARSARIRSTRRVISAAASTR